MIHVAHGLGEHGPLVTHGLSRLWITEVIQIPGDGEATIILSYESQEIAINMRPEVDRLAPLEPELHQTLLLSACATTLIEVALEAERTVSTGTGAGVTISADGDKDANITLGKK